MDETTSSSTKPCKSHLSSAADNSLHPQLSDGMNVLRGCMMGCADVVPGVSGGTLALILGIYERLVTAISRFDLTLLGHLRARRLKEAATHIDLRFLVGLGCGIGMGIIVMAMLMSTLIENDDSRPFTLAAFFGLILASGILVARMIVPKSAPDITKAALLWVVGYALALAIYWFTTFHAMKGDGAPSLVYLFCCGALAICAMILPGISGAMILLLLGVYVHVTSNLKQLLHFDDVSRTSVVVVVFCAGCATGLLSFSKLLRHLLTTYRMPTMALLCGFIFGALPKLWPFQVNATPEDDHEHFQPVWPNDASQFVPVIIVAAIAFAFVFFVDRFARGKEQSNISL